jgi:hypothetical protein
MRVLGLGLVYGALFGLALAAVFGVGIAVLATPLGLPLPHNLAGQTGWGVVRNTAQVGLIAGALGGALLGLLILAFARGREPVGRRIGAVAAVVPLVWLPYFAARGLARQGIVTGMDIVFFALLALLPLALAALAGLAMGGRLARAARG